MWMEETIGERINNNRTNEAVATGADQIAVGCPFCRVMLSDGLTAAQSDGTAREEVEVLDVAQMLLASVKGEVATRRRPGEVGAAARAAKPVETKAEPEAGDVTQTAATVTATEDVGPAAKASGGSSLFDVGGDEEPAAPEKAPAEEAAAAKPSGGSLFDVGGDDEPEAKAEAEPKAEPAPASGGSLFDIAGDEPEAKAEPQTKAAPEPKEEREPEPPAKAPEPEADAEPEAEAEPEPKQERKPKPTSSGEAHQPKTDADINESGSLFDL